MIPTVIFMTFEYPKDEDRFRTLVVKYWDVLVNVAREILGNSSDAEEAAQEAFIKLYVDFDKYKDYDDKSLVSLMYLITKSRAIDIYRKNKSNRNVLTEYNDEVIPSPSTFIDSEYNKLSEAMLKLSETDRKAIMLKYYYEYGIEEIAESFGIGVQGAYKKIERAKKKLASLIKEIENGQD